MSTDESLPTIGTPPIFNEPPVRSCCQQRHWGVVCPDGKVMCCICFDRVEQDQLHTNQDGVTENMCKSCGTQESSH